jgi:hypothetical protein
MRNDALVAAFARAVAARFAAPNEPLQSAALARAAVPLLERLDGNANGLLSAVAEVTLGDTAPEEAERVLRQAIRSSDGAPRTAAATAVLRILLNDWNRQGSLEETPNPYLRAAQARLLAMLAPDLTESSAATATTELLRMLPRTHDYVAREAIARAMAALAPRLSDPEREVALTAAKAALAKTGFSEEATAWARTVAELLPVGPAEFTAGIVEILKYPTAAGTPTEVLLGALADRRSDEAALRGRTRLDSALLDWLEDQLPNGPSLADPPLPPPSVPSEGAARAPG